MNNLFNYIKHYILLFILLNSQIVYGKVWLEMTSLGADAITEQMIKRSAKEALDIADETVSKEVKEELAKVVGEVDHINLDILLQNKDYKKFYDDLINNPSNRKFINELTIEEEAVLKFYTTNEGYNSFNKALRDEIPMTEFHKVQESLMNKALDKLPNYNNQSKLWRGLKNLSLDNIKTMYTEGTIVIEKHFISSAYNINDFIQSSRQRNFEYIIRIEGKRGKLIEPVSTLPEEAEVLFKSGTQFKVEKASYDLHPDDSYLNSQGQPFIWTIILKEI